MKIQDSVTKAPIPAPAEKSPFSSRPFAEPAAPEVASAQPNTLHHSLRTISFAVQPKLTIGQPNDKYEQEADRVAEQVVQQINAPQFSATGSNNPDPNTTENGKPKLQLKPIFQRRSAIEGEAIPDLESSINRARGGGQSLDPGLQAKMGRAMGADFSRVKVHTDAQSDRLSKSIQAKAFTTGQDVFFRQGAYEPSSRGGQELIAHELTHVVQQNGGAVKRKLNISAKEQTSLSITSLGNTSPANTSAQRLMSEKDFKAATGESSLFHPRKKITAIDNCLKKIDKSGANKDLLDELLTSIDVWLAGADAKSTRRSGVERLRDEVTAKHSNAQTGAATVHAVSKGEKNDATNIVRNNKASGAVVSPTQHPMYKTFQARVNVLFSEFPAPPDLESLTSNIWTQICASIDASDSELERRADNTTYVTGKHEQGIVDLSSPGYQKALTEFYGVMETLKQASESEFVKAKSFGFWSKSEGRAFAEEKCDLTLETSGLGALFDGMPSLNAHDNGWDVTLWGSLSRAFGQAVAEQMRHKDKSVHVCIGGGTEKTNIFGAVESKALEIGASAIGKTLQEAVTFHAVAAKYKTWGQREIDWSAKGGDLPGTWYSGHNWNVALKFANENYATLPESVP